MKNNIINISYKKYKIEELDHTDYILVERAKSALKNSYAPYSGFHVASAILLDNGEIITSTNQESEVFPSGICAERSLLYFVQSNHLSHKIISMAIVSDSKDEHECFPCGACRQVMFETEKRNKANIRTVMAGKNSAIVIDSAKQLLPFTFELNNIL